MAWIRWARAAVAIEAQCFERAAFGGGEIDFEQTLFGEAAALHALGEPDLFLHGQEIGFADFLQVEADGVADRRESGFGGKCLLIWFRLCGDAIFVARWSGGGPLEDFDPFRDQPAIEPSICIDVIFRVRIHRHDVVRKHKSLIATLIEQTGDHCVVSPHCAREAGSRKTMPRLETSRTCSRAELLTITT